MTEIVELGGHAYRLPAISVFDQLDIVNVLAPILNFLATRENKEQYSDEEAFTEAFAVYDFGPGKRNEVLKICLGKVFRKNKTTWGEIYKNGSLMFVDIDLKTLIGLIYKVLEINNILSFFTFRPVNTIELEADKQDQN